MCFGTRDNKNQPRLLLLIVCTLFGRRIPLSCFIKTSIDELSDFALYPISSTYFFRTPIDRFTVGGPTSGTFQALANPCNYCPRWIAQNTPKPHTSYYWTDVFVLLASRATRSVRRHVLRPRLGLKWPYISYRYLVHHLPIRRLEILIWIMTYGSPSYPLPESWHWEN